MTGQEVVKNLASSYKNTFFKTCARNLSQNPCLPVNVRAEFASINNSQEWQQRQITIYSPFHFRDYFGEKIGIYFAWLGMVVASKYLFF